jgi:nigerose phosphorylase
VKKRKLHPDEYLGAAQGVAVPTRVIKQADVVMMLNLFREDYSPEEKTANWEYYEPRTEHGSSLSACAYAMVAADIGKTDWAYKYFLRTAKLDLEAKYKVYVGTIFMGGSHPAANGGAWMASVFGFCGLRADAEKVTISPRLYKKWKAVHFRLRYKNDRFSLTVSGSSVSVTAFSENISEHLFCIGGTDHACRPGSVLQVGYK